MKFSVTYRHMEASDAMRDYAKEKVERIRKYFPDPIMAHVVFSTERGYQHVADVNIQLHNGIAIKGRETTEDMYSSIDLVMAKIERQVRRYKERISHHKARADLSEIPVAYHVLEAEGAEVAAAREASSAAGTSAAEAKKPAVIRTTSFTARALTVDEAIMQMNLIENNFLVFRDTQSGHVNVIYKREDGNFGLIETGPPR